VKRDIEIFITHHASRITYHSSRNTDNPLTPFGKGDCKPKSVLVGLKETLEDVAVLQRLLEEKHERVQKARKKLREMGMIVLDEEEYQIPCKL
jgi:hypothetical protein